MAERLDVTHWRPVHTRIAAALGIGWMLDAFEVQIIGSVIPGIQAEFGLDGGQAVFINVIWFTGIALGALGFGYLADRIGRRRLFVATLIMYSVAAVLTATAPTYEVFVFFRFLTALGVGGEYSAITSAIAEFTPKKNRGLSNGLVMTFWALGGILASLVSKARRVDAVALPGQVGVGGQDRRQAASGVLATLPGFAQQGQVMGDLALVPGHEDRLDG